MSNDHVSELEELKIIYQEIIEGSSPINGIYVKHLTELDNIEILRKRIEIFNRYVKEGVPSEKEKLKELEASEEWTKNDEDDILSLKYQLKDNEKNKSNLLLPQQREFVDKVLKELRKKLAQKLVARDQVLGITADKLGEQDAMSFMVYMSLHKDRACTQPLFKSYEEFEAQEEEEVEKYVRDIDITLSRFSDDKIRKLSVLPFFINAFSYSKDNVSTFVKRAMCDLTHFQVLLFSLGNRNINILSQTDVEPPEMLDDVKIDDIVLWYDKQYSVILGKQKSNKK